MDDAYGYYDYCSDYKMTTCIMEIELKKLKDRVKNIETTIGRKVRFRLVAHHSLQ